MAKYSDMVQSIIVIEGKEIPVLNTIQYLNLNLGRSDGFVSVAEYDSETSMQRLILLNTSKIDYIKSTEWQ